MTKTRLRADIRRPIALATAYDAAHARGLVPSVSEALVRGMTEGLVDAGLPVPVEPPPTPQQRAARARWRRPEGDVYAKRDPADEDADAIDSAAAADEWASNQDEGP